MFNFVQNRVRGAPDDGDSMRVKSIRNRDNRYRLEKKLGEGGMGMVFFACDLATREPVAVKVTVYDDPRRIDYVERDCLKRLTSSSTTGERFENKYVVEYKEAFLVRKHLEENGHKSAFNILKMKSPVQHELWIIQEHCEHGDLSHIMKTLNRGFTVEEVRHIVANVVLGLRFIHSRQIVHKDIKCLNILLTRAGRVKICDFGRAEKFNPNLPHCQIDSRVSIFWMAPEMFYDDVKYGYEVDIWALGITIIEMLRKDPPFSTQHGDMVSSHIMNLRDLRLKQLRKQLGINAPPKKLVENSKGKNNNYAGYYMSDAVYFSSKNRERDTFGYRDVEEREQRGATYFSEGEDIREDKFKALAGYGHLSNTYDGVHGRESLDAGRTSEIHDSHVDFMNTKENSRFSLDNIFSGTKEASPPPKKKHTTTAYNTEEKPDSDSGSEATFIEVVEPKRPNLFVRLRSFNPRKKSNDSRKTGFSNKSRGILKVSSLNNNTKKKPKISETDRLSDFFDPDEDNLYDGPIRKKNDRKSKRIPPASTLVLKIKGPKRKNQKKKKGGTMKRKSTKASRKKKSLVGELFSKTRSTLARRKSELQERRRAAEEKRRLQKMEKERIEWKRRHSYSNLELCTQEEQLHELIAWCCSIEQKKRPSSLELLEHPFIINQVKSLIRCEGTECGIREHSDYLLRSEDFLNGELLQEDLKEDDSDDDCFLTDNEIQLEKRAHRSSGLEQKGICTCSESQIFLRKHICEPLSQGLRSKKPAF